MEKKGAMNFEILFMYSQLFEQYMGKNQMPNIIKCI